MVTGTEIEDAKKKTKMGGICFLPSLPFLISLFYYFYILFPLAHGRHIAQSAEGIISRHYDTLFILLAVYATVASAVLIYCVVHLIKIRTLNTPTKMIWVLVLVIFMPVSFLMFWYFQIRKEPENMPVNERIA
jgi:hypothetical protein